MNEMNEWMNRVVVGLDLDDDTRRTIERARARGRGALRSTLDVRSWETCPRARDGVDVGEDGDVDVSTSTSASAWER